MIENIPLKYNENLAKILTNIIEVNLVLDSRDAILGNMNNVAGKKKLSESISESIKEVLGSAVVNFDETYLRVNGKQQYMHTASTPDATYQTAFFRISMALPSMTVGGRTGGMGTLGDMGCAVPIC